jgi:hypothetical protein
MAVYKVPQDVEADDKLIGPFTFRQFIYLIIVALLTALAWWMAQLFVGLIIIPLPFIIFFGALALPIRKDQPMEVYLAAMVSFYLKPRKRLWDADGIDSLIEITVPKTIQFQLTKDMSSNEAVQRLGYLAQIVDSQGWAVRGQGVQAPNSSVSNDVYFESQQIEDVLDSNTSVSQSLDNMINQSDAKHHQEMIDRLHQQSVAQQQPAATAAPEPAQSQLTNPYDLYTSTQPAVPAPVYDPYPTNIQQSVIQPLGPSDQVYTASVTPAEPPTITTSEKPVSPDIINLANNADLSIETIAREANRIKEQENMTEEVVISLR